MSNISVQRDETMTEPEVPQTNLGSPFEMNSLTASPAGQQSSTSSSLKSRTMPSNGPNVPISLQVPPPAQQQKKQTVGITSPSGETLTVVKTATGKDVALNAQQLAIAEQLARRFQENELAKQQQQQQQVQQPQTPQQSPQQRQQTTPMQSLQMQQPANLNSNASSYTTSTSASYAPSAMYQSPQSPQYQQQQQQQQLQYSTREPSSPEGGSSPSNFPSK